MPVGKNLISRLVRRGFVNQLVLAALLFISAGSLKFWQGWVFMVLNLIAGLCSCIYFYKHDPQLLERRMLKKEKISEQRLIMTLWKVLAAVSIVLSGYDYRFGWSRTFPGPVPLWLTLLALLLVLGGHVLFF
jgi:fatty acid desaturase